MTQLCRSCHNRSIRWLRVEMPVIMLFSPFTSFIYHVTSHKHIFSATIRSYSHRIDWEASEPDAVWYQKVFKQVLAHPHRIQYNEQRSRTPPPNLLYFPQRNRSVVFYVYARAVINNAHFHNTFKCHSGHFVLLKTPEEVLKCWDKKERNKFKKNLDWLMKPRSN